MDNFHLHVRKYTHSMDTKKFLVTVWDARMVWRKSTELIIILIGMPICDWQNTYNPAASTNKDKQLAV